MRRASIRLVMMAAATVLATRSIAFAQTSWGIGVTSTGVIVFCDPGRSTVWRIEPDGTRSAALTGITCRAVVSSTDDAVYGEATPSDVNATRGVGIWEVRGHEPHTWILTPTLTPPPGVSLVRNLRGAQFGWDGAGVGSQTSAIVMREASGATAVVAGGAWGQQDGDGREAAFANISGMALAPDSSLVVADSGNIRRVSTMFTVRTEARRVVTDSHLGLIGAHGLWARELGVATDASGAAVVVDPEAGRIVHVARDGTATPIWEPTGLAQRVSGGRWGWRPAGVAMMGRTYYVLDEWMGPALLADLIGSPRVSQVDAAGRVTRIVSVGNWSVRAAASALMVVLLSVLWSQRRRR